MESEKLALPIWDEVEVTTRLHLTDELPLLLNSETSLVGQKFD